jgi:hypothetical protein
MEREANQMRNGGPVVLAQARYDLNINVDKIITNILHTWEHATH